MVAARNRAVVVTAVLTCAALVAVGCTSSGGKPNPSASVRSTDPSSSSAPSTTSATSTIPSSTPATSRSAPADPRVAAAVKAYQAFATAFAISEQHPPKAASDPYAPGGNFPKYMFDPARAEYVGQILSLTQLQVAYRGTPPVPRVSVTNVDLGAKPYPTIVLGDCPVPARWKVVATTPGAPPTVKSSPSSAPPPYLASVQMIFYRKHWGVSRIGTNTSKTCTP